MELNIDSIIPYKIPKFNEQPIKIVNLKHRTDRKESMIKKLKEQNIDNYEITDGIYGKEIDLNEKVFNLFEGNNFGYSFGVLGCMYSHINLIYNLAISNNDYYIIFEDDLTFCDNLKKKLECVLDLFLKSDYEYLNLSINLPDKEIANGENIIFKLEDCDHARITYGYIIKKSGAIKIIKHIIKNPIKYPPDHPQAYSFFLKCGITNKKLVYTDIYGTNNNFDSDIQRGMRRIDRIKLRRFIESMNFYKNNISQENANKNIITVSFCDWWKQEYCGGDFNFDDNFFMKILRDNYKNYFFQIIQPNRNPQILFFSCFGNSHKRFFANRKIYFSGEPTPIIDYAIHNITFNMSSNNNTRLPLWFIYCDNNTIANCMSRNSNFTISKKEKFCSFIGSNSGQSVHRKEFIEILSKYKKVDCGGAFMNNIGYVVPRGENCSGKIEHNNNYKFAIAFENTKYQGYVTEKIIDCYKSNCIPIYWGCNEVVQDFNSTTFINANDFANFDELAKYVIKVDNDDELYKSYFKEPFINKCWLDEKQKSNYIKNIAENIVGKKIDKYKINLSPKIKSFWIDSTSYYSMQSFDKFINYFFDGIDIDIINNCDDNFDGKIYDIQDIDIKQNKLNIMLCVENCNYHTHYMHYNKYGNYSNDLINIYLYNHIDKIELTNNYIAIPIIYLQMNYLKKFYNAICPSIYTEYQNKKFCLIATNTINLHENNGHKRNIINVLSQIGKCDTLNTHKRHIRDKSCYHDAELLNIFNQYKFVFVCENSTNNGYITEKIFNCYFARTIPIYFGSKKINNYFNSNTFVNMNEYEIDNNINLIKSINTKEIFESYINSNIINDLYSNENYKEKINNFIK